MYIAVYRWRDQGNCTLCFLPVAFLPNDRTTSSNSTRKMIENTHDRKRRERWGTNSRSDCSQSEWAMGPIGATSKMRKGRAMGKMRVASRNVMTGRAMLSRRKLSIGIGPAGCLQASDWCPTSFSLQPRESARPRASDPPSLPNEPFPHRCAESHACSLLQRDC